MYCTRGKLVMDYLTENLNLILISLLIVFAHVAAHDWGINTMWSDLEEYQNQLLVALYGCVGLQ